MRSFVAIVHHETGSAYGISFPDLPGCFAAADDESEIYHAAQEALSLYAGDSELPTAPRSLKAILRDPEIAADLRGGAVLLSVPLIVAERKIRVNLMIDPDLLRAIDDTANAVGLSRSEFVSQSMSRRLIDEIGAVIADNTGKSAVAARLSRGKPVPKVEKAAAIASLTDSSRTREARSKVGRRKRG